MLSAWIGALLATEAALVSFWAIQVWRAGSAGGRPFLLAYLSLGGTRTWGFVVVYGLRQTVPSAMGLYAEG